MRILYVEDNQANVYLVKRVAQKHEVINYIDGADALQNIDTVNPDLILMDIQLAGHLSGLDVVRKLREGGNDTPIVAVTAYAMIGDREKCLAAGCNEYMSKPLPITELVSLIKKYDALALAKEMGTAPPPEKTGIGQETMETAAVIADDIAPVKSDITSEVLIIDVDKDENDTDDDESTSSLNGKDATL